MKYKLLLYPIILLTLSIIFIEFLGFGLLEYYSTINNKDYKPIRKVLVDGSSDSEFVQTNIKYAKSTYLFYTPTANYKDEIELQHNSQGFRNTEDYNYENDEETLRIICLGGSTTYGSGIDSISEAFPAKLEKILSKEAFINNKYKKVEVINAGIEGANMVDILLHYQFKIKYFNPDLVILHSGFNDLDMYQDEAVYTPDYSHFKKNIPEFKKATGLNKFFLKSNFLSFVIIRLFYDIPKYKFEERIESKPEYLNWFVQCDEVSIYSKKYNAFYNNSKTLINEIVADSSKLIILPELIDLQNSIVLEADSTEAWEWLYRYTLHHSFLKDLSNNYDQVYFVPEDSVIVAHKNYVDFIHCNGIGNQKKAEVLNRFMNRQKIN